MLVAVTLLSRLFAGRPLAGVVFGALAVDFLAGRGGVGWSWGRSGRAALRLGATTAVAAVGSAAALGLLAGQARLVGWGVDVIGLLTGGLAVIALAFRDELWLRWAPWRLLEPHAPAWLRALTPVAFGVAATLGGYGFRASAVALAAALGALSVALLRRTESPVASVAAAALVRVLANPTPLGFELRWRAGALAPLEAATGVGAWSLAAALGVAAALVWRRGETSPDEEGEVIPR
jgi:hypothetical protein